MIPLSKNLEQWCVHKSGVEKVTNHEGWVRQLCSAELNEDANKIISSFGNKEFEGMVGFVDMRGFSTLCHGKTPKQVHSIVAPFISAVIDAASRHHCFIDKTIGDEVMVVMPWFDDDTVLSDARLPGRKVAIYELSYFIQDLIISLSDRAPDVRFSAGFALGNLFLDRVGSDQYKEWTVYGNCVNAAKRLQSRKAPDEWSSHHVLAVGQLEAETTKIPEFAHFDCQLDTWNKHYPADFSRRVATIQGKEEFKGVGSIFFAHCAFEPHAQRQLEPEISVAATP